MSCTPSATATEYTTITTFTTSTSLSQSVVSNQAAVTTVVQQTCIASASASGSGCVSSAAVTQVNTIGGAQFIIVPASRFCRRTAVLCDRVDGSDASIQHVAVISVILASEWTLIVTFFPGGDSTTQVPVIVTVPVTQTQPTKTLFATCSDGSTPSQTTSPSTTSQTSSSSTPSSVTTSVLVVSIPSPSIITQSSSTTLSNGDVIATGDHNNVHTAGIICLRTNVAPIVGGVVGGFVGLVVIVGALWYFCRRRRSWDDIFDREALGDEEFDIPIAVGRDRDRNKLDLGAEPKPYQYGLVGHVTPPPGSGSPPSTPRQSHPSLSTSAGEQPQPQYVNDPFAWH
ncbi:hypothetical protein EDB19DRAFT_1915971 [Suillus lakei]|nr:hypothetical protein EDB19DRAFT_1915971 [Suillus lakei]